MAVLNAVKREIVAKIVYYGPGLSGKTANIQKIHETMDPANVGELTSLATESDRTLFFDFVPIQLGSIAGLNTRFQLFTVPGQVFYNQTRRTVLENTDGVVFVADSQPEQLENNLESLSNLEENLAYYGKKLADIPFVLQFNKQDIPGCMTEEELGKVLNKYGAPSLRASCIEGYGVMETLAKISTMVLSHLREQMTKKGGAAGGATLKRTYSKEGVSDDQVVSNLLSDIAAAGGAQEAQAAARAESQPAPARPAGTPASGLKPAAPRPGGGPPPPIAPARTNSGGAVPKAAPGFAPTAAKPPANAPVSASLSPEDLLNDLDRPAAPAKPAKVLTPTPMPSPGLKPLGAAPPPPPPARAGIGPVPSGPPVGNGTASGLKVQTAKPAPTPGAGKTAEELLESMEREERSAPGDMVQESQGSFGTKSLWDDDAPSRESGPSARKKTTMQDAPKGGGLFDIDESEEIGNRTSIQSMPGRPGAAAESDDGRTAASMPRPGSGGSSAAARIAAASDAIPLGDGRYTVNVTLADGQNLKLTLALGDLPAPRGGAQAASKGQGGGVVFLALFSLLVALATAAFVVAGYLGMLPPRGAATDGAGASTLETHVRNG